MGGGNVNVICKEMIKPSLPTPAHLRTYEISSLDQFAVTAYIRLLSFYRHPAGSGTGKDGTNSDVDIIVLRLKRSLSEALTHYHPLAGRFVGHKNMIDCDDSGAEFTSAAAVGAENLFQSSIDNPDMDFLEKLLPKGNIITDSGDVILAVQVTRFDGGGISVGVCISHKISDGTTLCSFLKCWSAAARLIQDSSENRVHPNFKELAHPRSSTRRPQVMAFGYRIVTSGNQLREPQGIHLYKIALKCFRLRKELVGNEGGVVPSRATSVMALIWHAIIEANLPSTTTSVATRYLLTFAVNIRMKMSPSILDNVLGNVVKLVPAAYSVGADDDGMDSGPPLTKMRRLLDLIKDGIEKIDGDYAKKKGPPVHDPLLRIVLDTSMKRSHTVGSCWLRLPFYEVDLGLVDQFGWLVQRGPLVMNLY